jgi:transposase
MSRALSVDLRVRVLAAVADGLTHRQAGERFGVGAASVNRWRKLEREQGDPKPKALGGDRRSGRIEAHGPTILGLLDETADMTLEEPCRRLADRGLVFGDGTVRRFLKRHEITRKKDRARRRAGPPRHPEAARRVVRGPTRPRSRPSGVHRRDLGLDQHGAPPWALPARREAEGRRPARPLEDHDLRRSAHHARLHRAVGAGRSDQPRRLRDLREEGAGSGPAARRHRGQWTTSPATRDHASAR